MSKGPSRFSSHSANTLSHPSSQQPGVRPSHARVLSLALCHTHVAVGDVQQVAQAAAAAVAPLVADAVLQDHVVRAEGAQDAVHLTRSPPGVDLVDLHNKGTQLQHTQHPSLLLCLLCPLS